MKRYPNPRKRPDRMLVSAIMLFYFTAFLLGALKETVDVRGLVLSVAVPVLVWAGTMWMPRFFPADKLLLGIANFLCALGILMLYITDRAAGTARSIQQVIYYGVGLAAMLACSLAVRYVRRWDFLMKVVLIAASGVLALPLLIGTEQNGATNWIRVAGISMQPSELVKIALLLVLAYYMGERRFWPWFLFSVYSLLILMLQKDLGTALIYYSAALLLYYASTGNLGFTGLGVLGGCGAAVLGYQMFAHVKKRVAIWKNPFLYYESSGYQIVQALIAIASGGLTGVGLGLGDPTVIPVYYTDCIFAVICEQFGILFGIGVLALYAVLILRGAFIARQARTGFYALLAMGSTAMLGTQTFVIIGGVLKLIPLTGVTMPFVSYGGTSLVSCMGLIGLIQGVAGVNRDDLAYDRSISLTGQEENGR